ncbi:UNVERIFIED_CONTAM: hypothetical protein K2H54_050890 [Gekko kuhli]
MEGGLTEEAQQGAGRCAPAAGGDSDARRSGGGLGPSPATVKKKKTAFQSPFAHKDEPQKEAVEALVADKDPEVATHRHKSLSRHCLLLQLGVAFILAGVVVGGASIYKYIILRHRVFHGQVCYEAEDNPDNAAEPYFLSIAEVADFRDDDNIAIIAVLPPKSSGGDPAIIVHDFERLLTVYLARQPDNCYVCPLNTSIVMPLRNLRELFAKLAAGSSLTQTYLICEEMVVKEEIDNVSDLGLFISQICAGKGTFTLQRTDNVTGIQESSAKKCHSIRHFENEFVVETKICQRKAPVPYQQQSN